MKENDLWKLSFSITMKLFSLLFTETKWQELQVIKKQTELEFLKQECFQIHSINIEI